MPRSQILAVESDVGLAQSIQDHLCAQGYSVATVHTAAKARASLQQPFDLVLLATALVDGCGLELLQTVRRTRDVPVLLLAPWGDEAQRIEGYSAGADGFLFKPFSLAELEVRIQALLRRVVPLRSVHTNALTINAAMRDISVAGHWAGLTHIEFRLFEVLHRHRGQPLSKEMLYPQVLHRPLTEHDRVLDMHVSHLRRKLRALDFAQARIETVWGVGYVYREECEESV